MADRLLAGRGLAIPAVLVAAVVAAGAALAPLYALAAVGGAFVLSFVLADASALLLLVVAAFPWDDALLYPSATVSITKLLGVLLLIGYLIRTLAKGELIHLPGTLLPVVLFTMLMLFSLLLSDDPVTGATKASRYLQFAGFFFLFVQLVRTRAQLLRLLRVLVLSTAAAATVGLVAFLTGVAPRASGPIAEANDFAYLIAAVLPFGVYLAANDRGRRALWLVAVVLMTATLFATLSRGALVGLAALAVWAIATGRLRVGGVLAGGLVLGAAVAIGLAFWGPLIGERLTEKNTIADRNVAAREALWKGAIAMAVDKPLLGVGTGQYGVNAADYVTDEPLGIEQPIAHNSFLEIAAESGVPALLAFLAFLGGAWRMLVLAHRRAKEGGDVEGARLASTAQALLVVSVVAGNFLSVQIMVPMWLGGAIAVALAASPAGRPRAAQPA